MLIIKINEIAGFLAFFPFFPKICNSCKKKNFETFTCVSIT